MKPLKVCSILSRLIITLLDCFSSLVLFHTLVTASGHRISLTKLHLIPIVEQDGSLNYIPAKDVEVGNVLKVMSSDNQLELSPVVDIIMEMKRGFYAPLTTSGKRR